MPVQSTWPSSDFGGSRSWPHLLHLPAFVGFVVSAHERQSTGCTRIRAFLSTRFPRSVASCWRRDTSLTSKRASSPSFFSSLLSRISSLRSTSLFRFFCDLNARQLMQNRSSYARNLTKEGFSGTSSFCEPLFWSAVSWDISSLWDGE